MSAENSIQHLSIADVVQALDEERKLRGRFPCRLVFVSTLSQYKELVLALRAKNPVQVRLSDSQFCTGDDAFPQLTAVVDFLAKAPNETYIIEGFGEYLRMAEGKPQFEQKVKSLMSIESVSCKRVWIPVFCARGTFFKTVGALDLRYDNAFFEVDAPESDLPFKVSVYPHELNIAKSKAAKVGLRSWFKCWEDLTVASGDILYTQKTAFFTPTEGAFSLRVITDPFSYIQEKLSDAGALESSMGTKAQWGWLASEVNSSTSTVELLMKKVLNVLQFRPEDILSRWNEPDENRENHHWLFWLWYHKGSLAGGDYFAYAIQRAKTPDDIPMAIETAILDEAFKNNVDAAQVQRRAVLPYFKQDKRSKAFWDAFERVPDNYLKLKLLTDETKDERVRAIKIVGDMLLNNERIADILYVLDKSFPVLAFYLSRSDAIAASGFKAYFEEYKRQKVKNIFDSTIDGYIRKPELLAVTSRNEALKSVLQPGDFTLWVDGMGLEWVDLLMRFVSEINPKLKATFSPAAAMLPTITSANKVWDSWPEGSYRKDDHLDSKSHIKDKSDGVDPAALIDLQFQIIRNLAKDIVELVSEKGRLVVTADHGMSRLAAIHFHKCNPTSIPPDGESCQSCRFCKVPQGYTYANDKFYKLDTTLVMVTHDHFGVPGYIPGETHGGMTPEEYLVPVLTFALDGRAAAQKKALEIVPYRLLNLAAKQNDAKECVFNVSGDKLVSVKAKANNEVVVGHKIGDMTWALTFKTLKSGASYDLEIYPNNIADGKKHRVSISRRGLVIEDDL